MLFAQLGFTASQPETITLDSVPAVWAELDDIGPPLEAIYRPAQPSDTAALCMSGR